MNITLQMHELRKMLRDQAEVAVKLYRVSTGEERGFISKNEAYKRYGRRLVDRWIREGLVESQKDGDKNHQLRISTVDLEAASKSSNYESFFTHYKN